MNYQQLLEQISEYIRHYYQAHDTTNLLYHNEQHIEDVVHDATHIANHYQLSDRDFFVVLAAAWFHDTGYIKGYDQHEEESARIAATFLKDHGLTEDDLAAIKGCILATKMPQQPHNLLEQIMCDADLYHLGTDKFFKIDKTLRKEINLLHHIDMSKLEWHRKTISFLQAHHYQTDYCQLKLTATKEENLKELRKKIEEEELEQDKKTEKAEKPKEPVVMHEEFIMPKKSKKDRPDKGIETMFRISSGNHQRLSDMADNKAHIMITVNSIILSAIISLLLRRLNEYHYLLIPTCILLGISLMAMTFAILSTRPSIPMGIFSRADVDNKKVNLLFFGNFYKMNLDDYTYGMEKMMEDREFLYGSLIRDVYAQGVVLGKKYRLLRISYNIFMFGLIIAVLSFVIAAAFFNNPAPTQILIP
ncbi:MAG TPA: Pycsar system effector family protein [Mucilaginibacter sp.]|jgi:predicted metal-dependent HD superfamily phosphohydrolase|nr:Pycsar system effector family protein [Mucilaginibacter sp.]